jgi:acyl dehydratase
MAVSNVQESFRVSREKIREFANALGERNPVCHSVKAAQAAGYPDLVAPPTFLTSLQLLELERFLSSPEVGLDISQILHGEQGFVLHRPVIAGDELASKTSIEDQRERADATFYSLATRVESVSGELVAILSSTIVAGATGAVS